MTYLIEKPMNNNVVLAFDESSGQEVILIGKGLGFNRKKGQVIDEASSAVERIFRAYDEAYKARYMTLLKGIDQGVLGVCAEIVSEAENALGELSEKLFLVLTDHISFALERLKQQQDISNPFLYEIKMLYPEAYQMGVRAQEMLLDATGIEIPEGEVGFITLHMHAARFKKDVKETVKNTRVIKALIELIERELGTELKRGTMVYDRLVSHLWYCLDRIEKGEDIDNPMGDTIETQFPEAFDISQRVVAYIEKTMGKTVYKNERVYMTIHIERLRRM